MNAKKLSLCLLIAFLGGCLPVMSLHSLYTDSDVVFEEKLLGTWTEDSNEPKSTWVFERAEEKNAYKLIFSDEEGKKGSFVAYLVKLQDKFFLDLFPSELPWELEEPNKIDLPYNTLFMIPAHTFIKIQSIEPKLKMQLTVESKMKELLEKEPEAIKYTSIEDRLILTATTKELQEFVIKYADDDRVFTDEIVLISKDEQKTKTKEPENKKQ